MVLSHGGDNDGSNDSKEELHSCGLFDVGPVVEITNGRLVPSPRPRAMFYTGKLSEFPKSEISNMSGKVSGQASGSSLLVTGCISLHGLVTVGGYSGEV